MHEPSGNLKVFLSGVTKEFGGPKKRLAEKLKDHHVTEVYCSEADSEPDFCKTWPMLENEIKKAQIFVLFLGFEFGASTDRTNVSITQREYETAKSLKKAIIVFRLGIETGTFENRCQEEFWFFSNFRMN